MKIAANLGVDIGADVLPLIYRLSSRVVSVTPSRDLATIFPVPYDGFYNS